MDRICRLELLPVAFTPRGRFLAGRSTWRNSPGAATARRFVSGFHARAQERAQRESYATLIEEKRRDGGAEFTVYTFFP
ncbi:MAG: hypothetical protein WDM96_16390 [Lacunisphaera sp.]